MRISDWSSDVCSSDLPVHGEMRHMVEHARLALAQGVPETVVPKNGSAIRLAPGAPKVISHEKVGRLVLDGDVILPADGATINARRSEEHTSELQSLMRISYAVFCLKKKRHTRTTENTSHSV